MAQLSASLICAIDKDMRDAAVQSVAAINTALRSAANARDAIAQAFCDRLVLLHDLGDLFRCEAVDQPAGGAAILHRIEVLPSDRYCELVAAVAAHGDTHGIRVVHGWPVLFRVEGTGILATMNGAASAPGKSGDLAAQSQGENA